MIPISPHATHPQQLIH